MFLLSVCAFLSAGLLLVMSLKVMRLEKRILKLENELQNEIKQEEK